MLQYIIVALAFSLMFYFRVHREALRFLNKEEDVRIGIIPQIVEGLAFLIISTALFPILLIISVIPTVFISFRSNYVNSYVERALEEL